MYFEKSLRFVFKLSLIFPLIFLTDKYLVKNDCNLRKNVMLGKDLLLGLDNRDNRSLIIDNYFSVDYINESAFLH